MPPFDRATALQPAGEDRLALAFDRAWWGGVGPHGGYLAGLLARAAIAVADPALTLRSLGLHYLDRGLEGPAEIEHRTIRQTRTSQTVQLTLLQDQKPLVLAVAGLSPPRHGPELTDHPMPDVPPATQVPVTRFAEHMDPPPAFSDHFELRQCLGPAPFTEADHALTGGWLRFIDEQPLDAPRAAAMMDTWWPCLWGRLAVLPRMPTLDLTIHFRRSLPATSAPVLASFRSRLSVDGYADEEGELWSADGELLVQSRQLAAVVGATAPRPGP
ncbi:MAG TPA: thioesterase family protein [Solirubrobacteraceae bacterium]|jgi:acyl-CoA thioesterase|nr:thioesterase family protein [Solirubrobacteraceae bacterium]